MAKTPHENLIERLNDVLSEAMAEGLRVILFVDSVRVNSPEHITGITTTYQMGKVKQDECLDWMHGNASVIQYATECLAVNVLSALTSTTSITAEASELKKLLNNACNETIDNAMSEVIATQNQQMTNVHPNAPFTPFTPPTMNQPI